MRFERLSLERYGHFTGYNIDFGAPAGSDDFHLIYGLNETGKTTLRDACIDFLFGFERITPYNFKHPNPALLIGAEISVNNKKISAYRNKRDNNSFLDADGEPISDAELKAALGGVSRANYLQMFSLDEDTLVDGGNEILKSQGDLGALLFSAASGLSSISESLAIIQQQAGSFFKPSGRKFRLNEHKEKLKQLKDRLREIDLQATAYDRLRKQSASAGALHQEAKATRDDNLARLRKLNGLIQAAEVFVEYNEVLGKLDLLGDAANVTKKVKEEVEQLARDSAANTGLLEENQQLLKRLRNACEEIVLDTMLLENAAAIHRLSEGEIEARYKTSSDIEHRKRDVGGCETEIRNLLRNLGQSDCDTPRSLLLSTATLGTVGELLDQKTAMQVDANNASTELANAKENEVAAQKEFEKYSGLPDLGDVSNQLEKTRSVADAEIQKTKLVYLNSARQEMIKSIAALAPWKGGASALQQIVPPDQSRLRKLDQDTEQLRDRQRELLSEITRLETDSAGQTAMVTSLQSVVDLIDDEKANSFRNTRTYAWEKHILEFEANDTPSADQLRKTASDFVTAMQNDDHATSIRLTQTSELASLKQVQLELAKNNARLQTGQKQKQQVDTELIEITKQISGVMDGVNLPQTTDLNFLIAWLDKREFALRQIVTHHAAQSDYNKYETEQAKACSTLYKAMDAAGLLMQAIDYQDQNLTELILQSEQAIDKWKDEVTRRRQAEKTVIDANVELKRRQIRFEQMQRSENEWEQNWATALSETWMEKTRPTEAKYILQLLEDLDAQFIKLDGLDVRIAGMKLNRSVYIDEVTRLMTNVGMEDSAKSSKQDPLQTADQIRLRLARAEEDQRRLSERVAALEEQEQRLQKIQDRFDIVNLRIKALCKEIRSQ